SPVTMPRIARRVVCGLVDVIATFSPTRALVSVDLPTLGRPTRATKPERCTARRLPSPAVAAGACPGASLVDLAPLLVPCGASARGVISRGHGPPPGRRRRDRPRPGPIGTR